MNIPKPLPRYWILKATSILLKVVSVLMLIVYTGQLFLWVVFRVNGIGVTNGNVPGDVIAPLNVLVEFIIRSVVLVIGAAAGSQLIDLFLSMEESLRTLVTRSRPASLINSHRGGQAAEREPELTQR